MFSIIFLISVIGVVEPTLYSSANQTIYWLPSYSVSNYAVCAINPNGVTTPFQVINEVAQHNIVVNYNYGSLSTSCVLLRFTQGLVSLTFLDPLYFRIDSSFQLNVTIYFTIDSINSRTFAHTLTITYLVFAGHFAVPTRVVVEVIVAAESASTPQCPTAVGTATIGSLLYSFSRNMTNRFCLTLATAGTFFNRSLDIMLFGQYLAGQGFIRPSDRIENYQLVTIMFGNGNYQLKDGIGVGGNISYTNQTCRYLAPGFVCNFLFDQDLYSLDYSNVSMTLYATSINGVVSDFRYLDANKINSFVFVPYGYINISEYMHDPNLPFPANNVQFHFYVNFSFSIMNKPPVSEKAACIAILLRNDYDPVLKQFKTASTNPAMEVLICPWWSLSTLPTGGIIATNLSYYGQLFNLHQATDANNVGSWKTYIFKPAFGSTANVSIDAMVFLKYIAINVTSLANYYVIGAMTGFRNHYGAGVSTFYDVSYAVTYGPVVIPPTPVPAPLPAPTPIPNSNKITTSNFTKSEWQQICIFGEINQTSKKCEVDPEMYTISKALISTPNIGLFLRLSPVIGLIDELSYFTYHEATYDTTTDYMSNLCWNLTNSKWIPYFMADFYSQIIRIINYTNVQDKNNTNLTDKVKEKGQTLFFLNNAQDFLFVAVPMGTGLFFIAKVIYFLCKKYRWKKLMNLLNPFRSTGYLLASLIGDNVQYLSFRCFQQLSFPKPVLQQITVSAASLVVTPIILFIILVCSLCLYPLIWALGKRSFDLEQNRQIRKSYFLWSALLIGKFCNGYLHASFHDSRYQLGGLFFSSFLPLLCIISCHKTFKTKIGFVSQLYMYIIKVMLISELFVETQINQSWLIDEIYQLLFGKFSTVLIWMWVGLLGFAFLNVWIWSFYRMFKRAGPDQSKSRTIMSMTTVNIQSQLSHTPLKKKKIPVKIKKTAKFAVVNSTPSSRTVRSTDPTKRQLTVKVQRHDASKALSIAPKLYSGSSRRGLGLKSQAN